MAGSPIWSTSAPSPRGASTARRSCGTSSKPRRRASSKTASSTRIRCAQRRFIARSLVLSCVSLFLLILRHSLASLSCVSLVFSLVIPRSLCLVPLHRRLDSPARCSSSFTANGVGGGASGPVVARLTRRRALDLAAPREHPRAARAATRRRLPPPASTAGLGPLQGDGRASGDVPHIRRSSLDRERITVTRREQAGTCRIRRSSLDPLESVTVT